MRHWPAALLVPLLALCPGLSLGQRHSAKKAFFLVDEVVECDDVKPETGADLITGGLLQLCDDNSTSSPQDFLLCELSSNDDDLRSEDLPGLDLATVEFQLRFFSCASKTRRKLQERKENREAERKRRRIKIFIQPSSDPEATDEELDNKKAVNCKQEVKSLENGLQDFRVGEPEEILCPEGDYQSTFRICSMSASIMGAIFDTDTPTSDNYVTYIESYLAESDFYKSYKEFHYQKKFVRCARLRNADADDDLE